MESQSSCRRLVLRRIGVSEHSRLPGLCQNSAQSNRKDSQRISLLSFNDRNKLASPKLLSVLCLVLLVNLVSVSGTPLPLSPRNTPKPGKKTFY